MVESIPWVASLSHIESRDLGKVLCTLESSLVKWGDRSTHVTEGGLMS